MHSQVISEKTFRAALTDKRGLPNKKGIKKERKNDMCPPFLSHCEFWHILGSKVNCLWQIIKNLHNSKI